jgi:hypothetical protein
MPKLPEPTFDKFRVEADLTEIVCDEWTNMPGADRMRLNGEEYRLGYLEDGPEDDPSVIYIVRKSDGMRFECEVWVSIYPADPVDIRATEQVPVSGKLL